MSDLAHEIFTIALSSLPGILLGLLLWRQQILSNTLKSLYGIIELQQEAISQTATHVETLEQVAGDLLRKFPEVYIPNGTKFKKLAILATPKLRQISEDSYLTQAEDIGDISEMHDIAVDWVKRNKRTAVLMLWVVRDDNGKDMLACEWSIEYDPEFNHVTRHLYVYDANMNCPDEENSLIL